MTRNSFETAEAAETFINDEGSAGKTVCGPVTGYEAGIEVWFVFEVD